MSIFSMRTPLILLAICAFVLCALSSYAAHDALKDRSLFFSIVLFIMAVISAGIGLFLICAAVVLPQF